MTKQTREQERKGLKELLARSRQERQDRIEVGQRRLDSLPRLTTEIEQFRKRAGSKLYQTTQLIKEIGTEYGLLIKGTNFEIHYDSNSYSGYEVDRNSSIGTVLSIGEYNILPETKNREIGIHELIFGYSAFPKRTKVLVDLSFPTGVRVPLQVRFHLKNNIDSVGGQNYGPYVTDSEILLGKNSGVDIEIGNYPHWVKGDNDPILRTDELKRDTYLYDYNDSYIHLDRNDSDNPNKLENLLTLGTLTDEEFKGILRHIDAQRQRLREAENAFENVGVRIRSQKDTVNLSLTDFLKNGREIYFGLVEKAIRDYKIK
jgi:hypothetical protein